MSVATTPTKAARRLTMAAAILLVVASTTAIAATGFTDVPDDNVFSGDITWLADAGVTKGCNPPENTQFCPDDDVTRAQMAAFMHRLAEGQVVDAGALEGQSVNDLVDAAVAAALADVGSASTQELDFIEVLVDSVVWKELLSVDVTATGAVDGVLNAHAYVEREATPSGIYRVKIATESCAATALGHAVWRTDTAALERRGDTISVTAGATTTGPTTYVLCATKSDDSHPDLTAYYRGLTATWAPSS